MKWVSINERMPEKNKTVIIFPGFSEVDVAYHDEIKWRCIDGCDSYDPGCINMCNLAPTHWMPLPQPPLKEQ